MERRVLFLMPSKMFQMCGFLRVGLLSIFPFVCTDGTSVISFIVFPEQEICKLWVCIMISYLFDSPNYNVLCSSYCWVYQSSRRYKTRSYPNEKSMGTPNSFDYERPPPSVFFYPGYSIISPDGISIPHPEIRSLRRPVSARLNRLVGTSARPLYMAC